MPCIMPKMPLPLHADAGMLWHPVRCVSPPAAANQTAPCVLAAVALSGMVLDCEPPHYAPLACLLAASGCRSACRAGEGVMMGWEAPQMQH
jgi:hypothetical protein